VFDLAEDGTTAFTFNRSISLISPVEPLPGPSAYRSLMQIFEVCLSLAAISAAILAARFAAGLETLYLGTVPCVGGRVRHAGHH
jgi:hypothetical protein